MYDIAIIGAGVVGGMIARSLSKFDIKVVLLEKESDVALGATRANSAIVHAGFDAKPGSLKAHLNVRGSELMECVCEELGVKNILVEQDNANKFEDGDIAQMTRSFVHLRPIIPMEA